MKAAIYARISDDREGAALGVQRQEADCRALVDRKGWQLAEVFVDNSVSAYSGKVRPAYQRMLDAIKAGAVDVVVVWHPDRLHRSPRELEDFIVLIEASGATVASVTAGDYDLATPEGRLVARIVGSVARKESEDKSRRSRRKHLELAEAGRFAGGGTRPFGFHDDRMTVHPGEATLIRQAADRVLAGEALRSICATWNAAGVATVSGRPWSQTVLRRLLTSGRIAGWREHQGRLVAEATWPAIVDRRTLDRLRALLLDPDRRTNGSPRRYLLTGLLVCGLCGARLVARPRSDKRRAYVCAKGPGFHGCGKIGALAQPLEDHVVRRALRRIDTPTFARARGGAGPDLVHLLADLADVEAQLEQAGRDYYADRILTREAFIGAQRALTARQAALRAEVGRTERQARSAALAGTGRQLAGDWPAMTVDQQRVVLDAVIDHVRVNPAVRGRRAFDPTRVKIQFR